MIAPAVLAAACQMPTEPSRTRADTSGSPGSGAATAGPARATGGGHYALGALDIRFSFSAVEAGGQFAGRFHQSLTLNGELVEVHGRVTCVSVDGVNGRAWVGGVITDNRSEAEDFQTARHQPGRDIWFRVLDSGEAGSAEPDRTTFLGFEGDAGFDTSVAYCAGQPWPDNNERTNAVTQGNIQVRP
jgi:hypothetical protein